MVNPILKVKHKRGENMNLRRVEVMETLTRRCNFHVREHSSISPVQQMPQIMELDSTIKTTRLRVPKDFISFYMRCSGGYCAFKEHGWSDYKGTLYLTLYSVEEMKQKNKELKKLVQSAVKYECLKRHYANSEVVHKCREIGFAYENAYIVGEIGERFPSMNPETSHYIIYAKRKFFVLKHTALTKVSFNTAAKYFASVSGEENVLISDTFSGIINKILDVILEGCDTVAALRVKHKKQAEAQRQQQAQVQPDSVFLRITHALKDGKLPDGFTLQEEEESEEDEQMKWAPGAFDGVLLYHVEKFPGFTQENKVLIERMIAQVNAENYPEAERLLLELLKVGRAVSIAYALQLYIVEHKQAVNADCLKCFARKLCVTSEHTECVKIGLALMAILTLQEDDLLVIYRLALCEEFTFFSLKSLAGEHNPLVFDLAKTLHGWGRIHAVSVLRPDSAQIQQWILHHGIENTVMPDYSAVFCWEKSGVEALLRSEQALSREDYSGVRNLIVALLSEGPVRGISVIENAEESVLAFLEKSASMQLCKEDLEAIRLVRDEFGRRRGHPNVTAIATLILYKKENQNDA